MIKLVEFPAIKKEVIDHFPRLMVNDVNNNIVIAMGAQGGTLNPCYECCDIMSNVHGTIARHHLTDFDGAIKLSNG